MVTDSEKKLPLVTRARNVQTRISAVERRQETSQYLLDLQSREQQIREHSACADGLLRAKNALLLVDAGRTVQACKPAKEIAQELKRLKQALHRNPKRAVVDDGYPARRVQGLLDRTRNALQELWRDHVGGVEALRSACILVEGIGEGSERAKTLEGLANQLENKAKSLPTDPEQIGETARIREQAESIMKELSTLVPEGPVRSFLNRMRDGGVIPLSEVLADQGLLDWLGRHGLAEGYEVRPKGGRRNWF